MKTNLLITLALLLPFFGFSQFKQSIDFVGGFDYSYRNVSTTRTNPYYLERLEELEGESGKFNWRFGVNFNQRIKNRFYFKTGFRLASIGFKGAVMTDRPDYLLVSQTITDYLFAEIPLVGRYEFGNKKFSPFVELGVLTNIHLATKEKYITDNGNFTELWINKNIENRFNWAGFVSIGMNYRMNDDTQIFAQPAFRYHLDTSGNSIYKTNYVNYGIEFGLRKKLK